MSHGGDQLARGARSAQFEPAKATQEKWNEIFPEDESGFAERMRQKKLAEALEPEEQAKRDEEEKKVVAEVKREIEQARPKYTPGQQVPFRAVLDRVVVARIETPEVENGLYRPEEAIEKPAEGIVVAVGPGKFVNGQFVPTTTVVGEKVLFGKFSGALVVVNYQEFLVLREEDIFLVKNS